MNNLPESIFLHKHDWVKEAICEKHANLAKESFAYDNYSRSGIWNAVLGE